MIHLNKATMATSLFTSIFNKYILGIINVKQRRPTKNINLVTLKFSISTKEIYLKVLTVIYYERHVYYGQVDYILNAPPIYK